MNKISIIVPAYNAEKDIERCLLSLVNQTMPVDIIVINDGSKDKTEDIVKSFVDKYPNIQYFYKENGGISSTRNFGLSKVRTKYFGFLDSDDYVKLDCFEKMVNKIENTNSDICMSDFTWVYPESTRLNVDTGYKNKKEIITGMMATLWNKIYRTSWVKELGIDFPNGLKFEDDAFLYRLAPHMDSVCYVEESFVNYIQKEGSITRTYNVEINDMIEVFKGIKEYYENKCLYNEYKDELEYVTLRAFLGNSYLRACRIIDKKLRKDTLEKGWNYLTSVYPNFKNNKYLKNSGMKNKYWSMINRFMYFNNANLFKFAYKIGVLK